MSLWRFTRHQTRYRPTLAFYGCRQSCRANHIQVCGKQYPKDGWTNIPAAILSKLDASSPLAIPNHPLAILKHRIESSLPDFVSLSTESPVVTVTENFDDLGFPIDHPGRSKTDSYYINKSFMLQTHTSAHEVATFRSAKPKWILTADVYRRDEIDSCHYPVFHQMEGARLLPANSRSTDILIKENRALSQLFERENIIIEDTSRIASHNPIQACHDSSLAVLVTDNLKLTLNKIIVDLFCTGNSTDAPLRIRWIDAFFPFTSPSFEVEVHFEGKWLEILGCGVVNNSTLTRAGRWDEIAWAFGLGLERICMPLFSIPDIRLFWTKDHRFVSQFSQGKVSLFRPYSKYPSNWKDISFWSPLDNLHDNDVFDLVRDVAGDLVESVACIDKFVHPATLKKSLCYRIHYRSMDRSLANDEINVFQQQMKNRLISEFGAEIR